MNLRETIRKPDDFDLRGKVAIVTGGAGLLGIEHCRALVDLGAEVWVADINKESSKRVSDQLNSSSATGHSYPISFDVTSPEDIKAAAQRIIEYSGGIHILINNAAIDPKVEKSSVVETSRLEHFPVNQWDFQLSVGLTGTFLCSQTFGGWMAENDGGVVLNIASDLAVIAPDQRLYQRSGLSHSQQPVKPVTYSVIKSAIVGLTKYLATYWAEQNVRVNALSPGGVFNGQSDEFVTKLTNLIPLARMAQRDEYHAAVQFLCSNGSRYMTGQNIVIDGGRSAW